VQARDAVLRALVDAVEIPVPPALVTEEVERHLEGEGRQEDEEHRAEVTADTERTLRGQFLLDAIAEAEDVKVGQAELVQFLVSSSRQYGMAPQEFVRAVEEAGQMPGMIAEVARRQALAITLSRATVTDSDGNAVDLEESMRRQAAGVPAVPGEPEADVEEARAADTVDVTPAGAGATVADDAEAAPADDAAAVPTDDTSTVVVETR
jgi:trigger factor